MEIPVYEFHDGDKVKLRDDIIQSNGRYMTMAGENKWLPGNIIEWWQSHQYRAVVQSRYDSMRDVGDRWTISDFPSGYVALGVTIEPDKDKCENVQVSNETLKVILYELFQQSD